jgi:hypothetical protein
MAVCLNCGAAQIMDKGGWRQMTLAELQSLAPDERAELREHQLAQALAKAVGMPDLSKRGGRA